MRRKNAFTLLEFLVVTAIIVVLAIASTIVYANKIEKAKQSQYLAELNAVQKASDMYYLDHTLYSTLQNNQPIYGDPKNIDFSKLVPNYISTLPHFSYWWVDYKGHVYHTPYSLGTVNSGILTLAKSTADLFNLSTRQILDSNPIFPKTDPKQIYVQLPLVTNTFKGSIRDPHDQDIGSPPTAVIGMVPGTNITTSTNINWGYTDSTDPDGDDIINVEWDGKQDIYTVTGSYTVRLRVQDSKGLWSEWSEITFNVINTEPQPLQTTVPSGWTGIYNIQDLNNMRNNVYGSYILMNNLDLNIEPYNQREGWKPIGTSINGRFYGKFNGNGLVIKNIYVNKVLYSDNWSLEGMGLFGRLINSDVRNLGLENVNITGPYYVGGLAGISESTTIDQVYTTGTVCNNRNNGANGNAGGIIGSFSSGDIINSYSTVNPSNSGYHSGGLLGFIAKGNITNCYSTGEVTPGKEHGGLIGSNEYYGVSVNSYWDTQSSKLTTSFLGTGKTTTEMHQKSTYINWDFTNIWTIKEGEDYPKLKWQE